MHRWELVEVIVVEDVGDEGEEVPEEGNYEEKLATVNIGPRAHEQTEQDGRQRDWKVGFMFFEVDKFTLS